ncbi:DUF4352 domain-containing protein [Virgibacillus sp. M23]|uniref:DUF4352 domain-containing protein n=1 Tax=Virgibacillus sp. M23 TaxID=3079030 RepID=UPI002A91105A|nr:DUF4352 domain-containing protein [Virgibacillus sp. M23]MDY7045176.1 DUF4352 domain-containing protein [Virgibacillus sp. M23]
MSENKLISICILIIISLFLASCSNDETTEQTNQTTDTEQQNDQDNTNTSEEVDSDEGNQVENKDEHIENQSGLQIGDAGTVVSSEERYTYEATLNEIHFRDIDEIKLFNETFAVVNVTIKNIDDQPLKAEDIFSPSLGEIGTNQYEGPVDNQFLQETSGIEIIEGEIAPGDSVTGDFVFDIDKFDNYHFAFGTKWDQIFTMAEWEFSIDEVQ